MTSRVMAAAVVAIGLVGCGPGVPTPGVSVEVTGTLTDAAGKPLKDVNVYFHPTGGTAQPASLKVGPDGTFGGKVIAGTYSWVVAGQEAKPGSDKLKTDGLKAVPKGYLEPSLDRQIEVRSGSKLDLKTG